MCQESKLVPIPDLLLPYYGDDSSFDPEHPEYGIDAEGRRCFVLDACIVPAVEAVWAAGMKTLGCCCGHGQRSGGVISLDTGGLLTLPPPPSPA